MTDVRRTLKERTPKEIAQLKELQKMRTKKIETLNKQLNEAEDVSEVNRIQDLLEKAYNNLDSVECKLYDKEPNKIPVVKNNNKKKSMFGTIYNMFM